MNVFKGLREKTGLSQSQFAKRFDIPVRTLQQWEQDISSPPSYVSNMLRRLVEQYTEDQSEEIRHRIPSKTEWKICIDSPFENCEKIYPIQQRKIKALIDDITKHNSVREIRIFGSSVTEKCHIGSDVDIFVDTDSEGDLISEAHDFEYDLWTNELVDERLKEEIMSKGVKVYG